MRKARPPDFVRYLVPLDEREFPMYFHLLGRQAFVHVQRGAELDEGYTSEVRGQTLHSMGRETRYWIRQHAHRVIVEQIHPVHDGGYVPRLGGRAKTHFSDQLSAEDATEHDLQILFVHANVRQALGG